MALYRSTWNSIHTVALNFPENATALERRQYKKFYASIEGILWCQSCSAHYNKMFYKTLPYDDRSRAHLFQWTVDIHNAVNARLGKDIFTVKQAFDKYEKEGQEKSTCPVTSCDGGRPIVKAAFAAAFLGLVVVSYQMSQKKKGEGGQISGRASPKSTW